MCSQRTRFNYNLGGLNNPSFFSPNVDKSFFGRATWEATAICAHLCGCIHGVETIATINPYEQPSNVSALRSNC